MPENPVVAMQLPLRHVAADRADPGGRAKAVPRRIRGHPFECGAIVIVGQGRIGPPLGPRLPGVSPTVDASAMDPPA